MTKRRLGELLRAEGLVTEDQVKLALTEQRKSNLFLGEALVKLGFVTEDAIASTISQQFGLPFLALDQYTIAKNVLDLFPESMLREYQFMPIDKIGNVLIIAGAGLMNHDVLDELERMSSCRVCQYVGTWKDITASIENNYKDRKKDPAKDEGLSSLGNMLLSDEEPVAEAPVEENDLADAVNAVTGSTSSVLEEALAAIEGGGKPVPQASGSPSPAISPVSGLPATASSGKLPSTAASGRISAFAGGKPPPQSTSGLKKAVPAGQPAGQAGQSEKTPAKKPGESAGVPKGGLLGFLKK